MGAANVTMALAHWRTRDRAPLRWAVTPPCDVLDDDAYDVFLAVAFRDLARLDTVTERICRLQEAIAVNLPMIEFCRARREEAAAARIERMVNVLRKWADEIVAAPETEQGRAA